MHQWNRKIHGNTKVSATDYIVSHLSKLVNHNLIPQDKIESVFRENELL